MSYMYRSTPDSLRFQSIPPLTFTLHYTTWVSIPVQDWVNVRITICLRSIQEELHILFTMNRYILLELKPLFPFVAYKNVEFC